MATNDPHQGQPQERKPTMYNATENLTPALPVYSGQAIGAVVKALDLDHGVLKERTARRFFAGAPVSEHSSCQIFLALGEVLVEREIIPEPPLFRQYDAPTPSIIAAAIERAAQRWDSLAATMQSRSGRTEQPGQSAVEFLRIVVVDLAVRVFALMRLAGLEPGKDEVPLWAQENGGGKMLRALTQQAGFSRERLAAHLGVSDNAMDNWLDGNNYPTPQHIDAIANALASQISDSNALDMSQRIHRQFAFARMADLIAMLIGREQVIELSSALARLVRKMTDDVNAMARPPIEEAAGAEYDALRFGTAHPSTHTLLRNLALVESDPVWQEVILAATVPWEVSFQMIGARNAGSHSAAGLSQNVTDIGYDGMEAAEPAIAARLLAESRNLDYGRIGIDGLTSIFQMMASGIECRRAVVRDFPYSPNAYFQLGSYLGIAGKHTGRRDLIDEGITECKIAFGLLPDWDAPAIEPGIILANIEAYEEALGELRQAAERLPAATPHLQFATGYVLMMLERHQEALAQFESVIKARSDYALALLYAARCAFSLGDTRRGIRYAKAARRYGEPDEYNAWRKRIAKSQVSSGG